MELLQTLCWTTSEDNVLLSVDHKSWGHASHAGCRALRANAHAGTACMMFEHLPGLQVTRAKKAFGLVEESKEIKEVMGGGAWKGAELPKRKTAAAHAKHAAQRAARLAMSAARRQQQ